MPPVGQVPPIGRRQESSRVPTAGAGSAQQQAGPVTRGRKRVATPHSEDVQPEPPARPRTEQQPDQPEHPAKRYTCEMCGMSFQISDDLRDYKIKHHGIGELWKCQDCNKTYSRKKGLEEHRYNHHSEVYLQECPVMNCDYKCNSKKITSNHQARQHG